MTLKCACDPKRRNFFKTIMFTLEVKVCLFVIMVTVHIMYFKVNGVSRPLRVDVWRDFGVVISVINMNLGFWNDVAFFM